MANVPIKILIVEDEMIIGARLSMYLTEMKYEVTGIIPRAEEVIPYLQTNPPDIVLLDIRLKGKMDGIDLASLIQKDYQIPIIFLTANVDDATFERAKATQPQAFLAKPFKKLDLKRALELTISRFSTTVKAPAPISPHTIDPVNHDRIFVHYKDAKVKIMLASILYVAAERNYCRIVTTTEDYLLSFPMKNLEDTLSGSSFQRIHRSHIINLQHLDEITDTNVVVGGKVLKLSKSYREIFFQRIKMF